MEALNTSIPNSNNVNTYLEMLEAMIARINWATADLDGSEGVNAKIDCRTKQLCCLIDAIDHAECLTAALKNAKAQLSQTVVVNPSK